jgi:hypothetical protein
MNGSIELSVKESRECLESGNRLVVRGWRSRSHNDFTKSLPKCTVLFMEPNTDPAFIPHDTGMILSTALTTHSEGCRIVSLGLPKQRVLNPGQIKVVLEECADLIFPATASALTNGNGTHHKKEEVGMVPAEAQKPEVQEAPRNEEDEELRFALLCMEAMGISPEATLGSKKATEFAKQAFGPSMANLRPLIKRGLLEAVLEEGRQRASSYRPGPRLIKIFEGEKPSEKPLVPAENGVSPDNTPDPLEKLRLVIAEEGELLRQKADIELRLEKVEKAKGLLREIEEFH